MKATNKIDVHHQIFREEYVKALKDAGVTDTIGAEFPSWKPETSIKLMDKMGIRIAMLSVSAPGVYFKGIDFPDGFSENLARFCNETIAGMKVKYPDRCGGFATIPMLNPAAALEELLYALDVL